MKRLIVLLALIPVSAYGQSPDPAFMQRALAAIQSQRNAAMDQAAAEKARADGLSDDLAKAQARIKELEPKKDESGKP